MIQVLVSNQQSVMPVDEEFVREKVAATLSEECVATAEITVAVVDDAVIHRVNRDHLAHDFPTDVISFVYESCPSGEARLRTSATQRSPGPACDLPRSAGSSLEGELVVSMETALRVASEYGWKPLDELTLYLVHGTLHICGYDDTNSEEEAIMRNREQEILKIWGLTPHYT